MLDIMSNIKKNVSWTVHIFGNKEIMQGYIKMHRKAFIMVFIVKGRNKRMIKRWMEMCLW